MERKSAAEYSSILVPKLIIQPILENAFNYGLRNKVDDGLLKVAVSNHDSELIISIEDNGDELSDAQLEKIQANLQSASTGDPLREMTGILNIQRRHPVHPLLLLFLQAGAAGGLLFGADAEQGTQEEKGEARRR